MDADRLLPTTGAVLTLGIGICALLLAWRRRLPADFVGRVKADAYLAMLRAMLVLLAGLALALGVVAGRSLPFAETAQLVAIALIAIGGVSFMARTALYLLRIKPQLNQLEGQATAALPAKGAAVPEE